MGHEWKVGDWAEINGARCLVYCVGDLFVDGIQQESSLSLTTWHKLGDEAKYLPECTGWDWEPSKPVEPTARKWEFGDWAHSPEGIVRFFFEKDGGGLCVSKDGRSHCFQFKYLEYLPDCTGFNWNDPVWNPVKPIAPPTGYRLLGRNETVAEGDLCIEVPGMSSHPSWRAAGGKSIGCTAGFRIDSYGIAAFARKAEIVNPIEPPPGYRIITDGVVSDGDMSLQDRGWYYSTAKGKDIAELLDLGAAKAYARKIEPKPIDPPKGYRLMKDEETIRHGDMFWQGGAWNQTGISVSEIPVSVALAKYARYRITAYARKIDTSDYIEPRYRPFANAAEFKPHRDKWIIQYREDCLMRIGCFDEETVWLATSAFGKSFVEAFEQWRFEDGTPFGVLDTKE